MQTLQIYKHQYDKPIFCQVFTLSISRSHTHTYTRTHFVRVLIALDGPSMEGLVKGQIKPVLTATSIRPCRQRLLSEQYLSLWGKKRPLVLHLKVQSHCFGVMGGGSGRLAFLSTMLLLRVQNFSLFHFALRILFRSLLHYVALAKRRDFPDKNIPHSACLCRTVPILTFLHKPWKDTA